MSTMDNSHPLLPGPRPPSDFIAPSYPPAPRRWSLQPPTSQSRGGYTSPDPSPTAESPFMVPDQRAAFLQSDHFRSPEDQPPMPMRQHPPPPMGAQKQGHIVHPQQDGGYYAGLQQRPVGGAHAKKGRAVRKVYGKQPTFLTKLYQILEQPEYHHIIRWDEAGEVIIIEKPEELADKILPLVYRQSRFASFSRQLNIYGFMRKVSLRHVDRGICDPDASTWSHPFLRRASTSSEIQGFKRRVPPRPSQAAKRRASMASNYTDISQGPSPSSSEGSYPSPETHRHHYLQDLDEEKPAIFASPPEHIMPIHEDISPKSGPFHSHSFDVSSQMIPPHSIAMPAAPTPLAHLGHHLFMDRNQAAIPGDIPASAPAHTTNFIPDMRIAQGHIRTRSVQGEPPTASLFSPLSPLGQPAWDTGDTEMISEDLVPPAYTVNHLDVWNRPVNAQPTASIPQHAPSRNGFAAASVPSDFASTPFNPSLGPATSDDMQVQPHTTISPGIYQDGFAVPLTKPSYVPVAPQALATTRQERRASITSSPYSPRSKAPSHISLGGILRGVNGRKGSTNAAEDARVDGDGVTGRSRRSVDEALPSAGIWDLQQGPFDGFFGEKVE